MRLPRDLTGRRLAKALCRDWDYQAVNQEGSHIILQTAVPSHQRVSIPDHTPLRLGTLNSSIRGYFERGPLRSPPAALGIRSAGS